MATPTEPTMQEQPLLPAAAPPPMALVAQQTHTGNTGHGSVGPVIAVLAVIAILGVVAGLIGRLCSGRSVMGYGHFDIEGWMESKCSSCLDGHVYPPRPPLHLRPSPPPDEVPVAVSMRDHSAGTGGSAEPSGPPAALTTEQPAPVKKEEEEEEEESEEDEEEEHEKENSHEHEHQRQHQHEHAHAQS